jgi:hypothetical protein
MLPSSPAAELEPIGVESLWEIAKLLHASLLVNTTLADVPVNWMAVPLSEARRGLG